MSKATYITDETFEKEVLQSETPVLVDFYADWCGPCRAISPMVEEIAGEAEGEFRVAKLDIDANGGTALKYSVQSIPTLILFKDGQPVERWVGIVPKQVVLTQARDHVSAVEAIER
jgi:thioredoxin 1